MVGLYADGGLIERCVAVGFPQLLAESGIVERSGQCSQGLQVFVQGPFRHQHSKQDIHWLAVNGIEINRILEGNQCPDGTGTILDSAVGNGNTVTYAGGAEPLPRNQPTKQVVGVDGGNILGDGAGQQLQGALFTDAFNTAQGAVGSNDFFDLHGIGLSVAEQFFFVFDQLAVELVGQHVNRGVEILGAGIGKQILATDMYLGLSFLDQFFDGKNHMGGGNAVVMIVETFEFVMHIVPDRIGKIQVMTADGNLHGNILSG
jgi:hypothetical protein